MSTSGPIARDGSQAGDDAGTGSYVYARLGYKTLARDRASSGSSCVDIEGRTTGYVEQPFPDER